jgi:tetratricopeptide (TPR) repeat protein
MAIDRRYITTDDLFGNVGDGSRPGCYSDTTCGQDRTETDCHRSEQCREFPEFSDAHEFEMSTDFGLGNFRIKLVGITRLAHSSLQSDTIPKCRNLWESCDLQPSLDFARAVHLLHVLAEQGDFRSAFNHAEELIEKYPDVAELWSNRGLILAKLGRRDLAIESYLQSITLDPTYVLAWSNLSASLMHFGRFEEALCCANEVILNAPKVPDPWYNRASALAQISEWTAAAQSYQEFLKLAPKHQRAARAAEAYEYCRSMAARK